MLVAIGLPPDMEEFSLQSLHSIERMLTSHPDARAAIPQRGDILAWFQTGSSPKFAIGFRILIISGQEC